MVTNFCKKCSSDLECPSIQKCLSSVCKEEYNPEPCVSRSECLRSVYGYGCVDGRCGCSSTNQDCPAGNFCTKKRCLLTGKYCNTNKECLNSNKGHRCQEGQCVCLSDMDCNHNYNCVNKGCLVDQDKMKDPMEEHMERMGHPSYHEEEIEPGMPGRYDRPDSEPEGLYQHDEF